MKNTTPLLSLEEKDGRPRTKSRITIFLIGCLSLAVLLVCIGSIEKPTTKGGETPVSKCGCTKKPATKTTTEAPGKCSCEGEKKTEKRGKLKKWVKGDKKGHIKNSQKADIKQALKKVEMKEEDALKEKETKARTEGGKNAIKEDDPRGFVVEKQKVVLDNGKKEKDDGAMTMVRRPKRLRDKDPKSGGIDWEENHIKPKVKSNKNVKKIDGEWGFHQSKLKTYAAKRIRKLPNEESLADNAKHSFHFPHGDLDGTKPQQWNPITLED